MIKIKGQRFKVTEILFNPSLYQKNDYGIHIDIRKELY